MTYDPGVPKFACEALITAEDVTNAAESCPIDPAIDPVEEWIDAASDIVYTLSGGLVFGRCTRTARPVFKGSDVCHFPPRSAYVPWPQQADVMFDGRTPLHLRGPIVGVPVVRIDGATLAPSNYAVVDDEYLIRRDGKTWPTYNDLTKPDTQVGTWAVQWTFGWEADSLAKQATIEIVLELAKQEGVLRRWAFPPGVVAANIQGVSAVIEEAASESTMPATRRFMGFWSPTSAVFSPEIDDAYRLVSVSYPA